MPKNTDKFSSSPTDLYSDKTIEKNNTPKIVQIGGLIVCLLFMGQDAMAAVKGYTTSVYNLDQYHKKIRAIFTASGAWNQDHYPNPIKEVRIALSGGSGFDMSNVPHYTYLNGWHQSFYRYTVPTKFEIGISYRNGDPVRHMSHKPANVIGSNKVSESQSFDLGITAGNTGVTIGGGVSWSKGISYDQKEFETEADYTHHNRGVNWKIKNKTINGKTNTKRQLIKRLTRCNGNNFLAVSDLPLVMRSDFRPEAAILYRKESNSGSNNTRFNISAYWTKTNYYFLRDVCSWYVNNVGYYYSSGYYDSTQVTRADSQFSFGWGDHLFRN